MDQPRVGEYLQMVRDGALALAQRHKELADADFPSRVSHQHRKQPQPDRVAERLERPGKLGRLAGSEGSC